jgi:ribonucleoside-diphosphate reductase alpha chain
MAFRAADSEIRNPDGSVVFSMKGIDVPADWSAVAADVLAQKYFRRAGVPARLAKVAEHDVPQWLWRSIPDEAALAELPQAERFGSETSARQVFERMAGAWTYWGWKGGYFDSEDDARAFFDEHCFMLAAQICAPNSPQWFNTGLHWAYGIDGPGQGHWFVDHRDGEAHPSSSAYERPQPHACFIQSVDDDLVGEGGIMDLWVREARLFKYGSGTGSNFSRLRGEGERLSGGGKSSGLMSFLKIGDRAAGAIKSGGTTRRAAKMVSVDIDHPDIEQFIAWKMLEEQKVAALVAGSQLANRHLNAVMQACLDGDGEAAFDPAQKPERCGAPSSPPAGGTARELHPAGHPVRPPGLQLYRVPDLRHRLAVGGLPQRSRAQNANNSVVSATAFLRAVEQGPGMGLTDARPARPPRS